MRPCQTPQGAELAHRAHPPHASRRGVGAADVSIGPRCIRAARVAQESCRHAARVSGGGRCTNSWPGEYLAHLKLPDSGLSARVAAPLAALTRRTGREALGALARARQSETQVWCAHHTEAGTQCDGDLPPWAHAMRTVATPSSRRTPPGLRRSPRSSPREPNADWRCLSQERAEWCQISASSSARQVCLAAEA